MNIFESIGSFLFNEVKKNSTFFEECTLRDISLMGNSGEIYRRVMTPITVSARYNPIEQSAKDFGYTLVKTLAAELDRYIFDAYIVPTQESKNNIVRINPDSLEDMVNNVRVSHHNRVVYEGNSEWYLTDTFCHQLSMALTGEMSYYEQKTGLFPLPSQLGGRAVKVWEGGDNINANRYPGLYGSLHEAVVIFYDTGMTPKVEHYEDSGHFTVSLSFYLAGEAIRPENLTLVQVA